MYIKNVCTALEDTFTKKLSEHWAKEIQVIAEVWGAVSPRAKTHDQAVYYAHTAVDTSSAATATK